MTISIYEKYPKLKGYRLKIHNRAQIRFSEEELYQIYKLLELEGDLSKEELKITVYNECRGSYTPLFDDYLSIHQKRKTECTVIDLGRKDIQVGGALHLLVDNITGEILMWYRSR